MLHVSSARRVRLLFFELSRTSQIRTMVGPQGVAEKRREMVFSGSEGMTRSCG